MASLPAQELARAPQVSAALSPAYLTAAIHSIRRALNAGELQVAGRCYEVLLSAVEPETLEDAAISRQVVWLDWLVVAAKLLEDYHDERIYGWPHGPRQSSPA